MLLKISQYVKNSNLFRPPTSPEGLAMAGGDFVLRISDFEACLARDGRTDSILTGKASALIII
jgi:hypothetical protein